MLVATGFWIAGATGQTVVMAVDYNDDDADQTPTESGFTAGVTGELNVITSINGIQATAITWNASNGRDRTGSLGSGAASHDFFRDMVVNLVPNGVTGDVNTAPAQDMLTFTGLTPNTDYTIQLWSYDAQFNNNTDSYWWNTTAGTGANATYLGTITNFSSGNEPTKLDDYSFTTGVTSSELGELKFGLVVEAGSGQLNGFKLSTVSGSAVPEPGSFALLLSLGTLGFVSMRRRGNRIV
ncbi:MAG: hypothetical protein SynsKO_04050 [Synoicihabitans sp.]